MEYPVISPWSKLKPYLGFSSTDAYGFLLYFVVKDWTEAKPRQSFIMQSAGLYKTN